MTLPQKLDFSTQSITSSGLVDCLSYFTHKEMLHSPDRFSQLGLTKIQWEFL